MKMLVGQGNFESIYHHIRSSAAAHMFAGFCFEFKTCLVLSVYQTKYLPSPTCRKTEWLDAWKFQESVISFTFSPKFFLTSCGTHVPNNALSRGHSCCLPISAHREYHAIVAPDGLYRVVCILRKKDGVALLDFIAKLHNLYVPSVRVNHVSGLERNYCQQETWQMPTCIPVLIMNEFMPSYPDPIIRTSSS